MVIINGRNITGQLNNLNKRLNIIQDLGPTEAGDGLSENGDEGTNTKKGMNNDFGYTIGSKLNKILQNTLLNTDPEYYSKGTRDGQLVGLDISATSTTFQNEKFDTLGNRTNVYLDIKKIPYTAEELQKSIAATTSNYPTFSNLSIGFHWIGSASLKLVGGQTTGNHEWFIIHFSPDQEKQCLIKLAFAIAVGDPSIFLISTVNNGGQISKPNNGANNTLADSIFINDMFWKIPYASWSPGI